jgi:LCP family protein required for cell wall assembly
MDGRRLGGAVLSAILPGLGQLRNGRVAMGLAFAIPSLLLVAVVWLLFQSMSTTLLAAQLVQPEILGAMLVLNGLVCAWRLASVGQAFLEPRLRAAPGRTGMIGILLIVAFVVLPHAIAHAYGTAASSAFDRVFSGRDPDIPVADTPDLDERLNVLLMGVDSGPGRSQALTDTLIVVSLDPVGKSVTMISIPRDMVNVPLGNGDVYAPKINSLLAYADRNEDEFPDGGPAALKEAIGALLGIEIHHFADVRLAGFVEMVDVVGGVDVTVRRALSDPDYGGFGVGPGWSIEPGEHHLDGANALAYARIRRSEGESDFTRAERQQQVLVALRNAAVKGNLLFSLGGLLEAVGDAVRSDLPRERLPVLAALAEEIGSGKTTNVVIKAPLVRGATNRYGSVQIPDVAAIRDVVAAAVPEPGEEPEPWPTPRPTGSARPTPTP